MERFDRGLGRVFGLLRGRRWALRIGGGAAVLATSVALLIAQQQTPPEHGKPIGARLELAAGEVTVKRGDEWPTVVSGIALEGGSELATAKGARALVRLSDGSTLFLRGDSKVRLGDTGVELVQGEVWLEAPPAERGGLTHRLGDVTVSAAEAGLSMKRSGGDVDVYVARGLAIVASPGGRVEVHAGEQAKVASAAAPQVSPLAYWDDWTGGMGDHRPLSIHGTGSGRIYGIDAAAAPGTPARTLEISKQSVRAVVRDGFAETEVDQTFSNPGGRQVEGWYWFTVPEHAVVTSFAVDTDGTLIEGEIIERQEASQRYAQAVRASHEPALLEWIDGKSYRARIFPVPASGSRRVVLRYMEVLPSRQGKVSYLYPMRGDQPARIGEFSLSVDLGEAGAAAQVATLADAVVENGGRKITMRRSGYTPRADFQLEAAVAQKPSPLRVARYAAGGDRADYLMVRYQPDVDWTAVKEPPGDVVVVVDTSGSGDDAGHQQKVAAAEAVLQSLAGADRFALIALDVTPTVLYPADGLAEATEKEISSALERLAGHARGGATDFGAVFDVALGRVHGKEQPAVVYIGDGLPTSGEVSGEQLAERLRRSLTTSRARFFTVAVGSEANHTLLGELARVGGGEAFRIDRMEAATPEVLRLASAIKTPTITDLTIDLGAGLDDAMSTESGKLGRGDEVVLLARTHHALPTKATVRGRLGGKSFERSYPIELDRGVGTALVPRLWAAEKMRRLLGEAGDPETQRGRVVELGLEYGLMTPFTSILALESEQAYQQQGIRRRSSPLRGVRLTSLAPAAERSLEATLSPISPAIGMGCSKSEGSAAEADTVGVTAAPTTRVAERAEPASPVAAATPEPAQAAMTPPGDEPAPMAGEDRSGGGRDIPRVTEQKTPVPDAPPARGVDAFRGSGGAAKPSPAGPMARERPVAGAKKLGPPPPAPDKESSAATTTMPKAVASASPAKPADLERKDKQQTKVLQPLAQCSDIAARPLADRMIVWSKRLNSASTSADLIARWEGARTSCELPDWRAQSALLGLVQARVRTEGAARELLSHFAADRDTQRFLAHSILRRSVDPSIAVAVRQTLFGDRVRWQLIDEELAALPGASERLTRLREVIASAPDDPEGELRLVVLLSEAGHKDEALAAARRLRDRGLMTPALSRSLGDALARAGFAEEAQRTYSEIVEFDPQSTASRALLGDIYLRNGWYAPAYRQYKALTDADPASSSAWLRLASAAAGSGRVDEALRVSRQVATAEGNPGPNDPRVWARLWSAARLGRLLLEAKKDPAGSEAGQAEALIRKLKELSLLSGAGALQILTWEDLEASLSLSPADGDKVGAVAEAVDASRVGLTSASVSIPDLTRLRWRVRWRADGPGREVRFTLHTLIWDGKTFEVKTAQGSLGARDKEVSL